MGYKGSERKKNSDKLVSHSYRQTLGSSSSSSIVRPTPFSDDAKDCIDHPADLRLKNFGVEKITVLNEETAEIER